MLADATTPEAVAAFRRAEHIPAAYSPRAHIARSVALVTVIGSAAAFAARSAKPADLLFIPAFLMAANLIEWAFHKNPMHRPIGPRILYKNHTLLHHRAFIHTSMPIENQRDLGLIMMPWYTMLLLFSLASPIALAGWALRGPAVAGIFYLVAAAYFVGYETLHALYHTPTAFQKRWWPLNGRWFQSALAHHRHHHRLDRMSHVNFNVTFPLGDALMRTKEREDQPPSSDARPLDDPNARATVDTARAHG